MKGAIKCFTSSAHSLRTRAAILLLVPALSWLGSCAVNPVTGKKELSLTSNEWETSTGAQQYRPAQQSQGGSYDLDPALTTYINRVGQKLAAVSDRPELQYEFVVLNNDVANAWALPTSTRKRNLPPYSAMKSSMRRHVTAPSKWTSSC